MNTSEKKKSGKKLSMEDILKPGTKLEARILTEEEVRPFLEYVENKQEEVLKLKRVDWEKLSRTYIII